MFITLGKDRLSELQISFLLRSSYRFPNGEHPIQLRLKYHGQKKEISTGLAVQPQHWISGSGCVLPKARHAAAINQQLQEIALSCRKTFEKLKLQFGDITLNELVQRLKGNEAPPETLMEYVIATLTDYKGRIKIDLAQTTYYKYYRTARYLEEYLGRKMSLKNIPVSRVDQSFLEGFFKFLRKEKSNAHNSAVALMNCLKTILHEPVNKIENTGSIEDIRNGFANKLKDIGQALLKEAFNIENEDESKNDCTLKSKMSSPKSVNGFISIPLFKNGKDQDPWQNNKDQQVELVKRYYERAKRIKESMTET